MKKSRNKKRLNKHLKVRSNMFGTTEVPRLVVFKSHQNFEAQLIDDSKGHVLAAVSTKGNGYSGSIDHASKIGQEMGKKIVAIKTVKSIVFDRAGYIYHGRIKAFAEAVRKEGVKF